MTAHMGSSAGHQLNWVCIGAQKAGTSTLFRLLRQHPDVAIPDSKEAPLFDRPVDPISVDRYMAHHFGSAPKEARCGTVSPQYMFGTEIAAQLHVHAPGAKVIALLRDPVERAFSHYRMNCRRGLEHRSFASAVEPQLSDLAAGRRPDPHDELSTYAWRGCYSSLLRPWFDLFGAPSMLVKFTSELEHNQAELLAQVQVFLGVEARPTGEVRAHVSPPSHRFSHLRRPVAQIVRRYSVVNIVPLGRQAAIADRIDRMMAIVAPVAEPTVDSATASSMRDFFAQEDRDLAALIGRSVPWRDC